MSVTLDDLPMTYASTRDSLHRVAVHIVARRRQLLSTKFGLRSSPGGFAAPAAGPELEVVRTDGHWLVRERTGQPATTTTLDLRTATLAEAAELVEVDLSAPFDAGDDTPAVGAVEEALAVVPAAALALGDWYAYGWRVLDAAIGAAGPDAAASVIQLWPEHFDAGCDLAAGRRRTNLGASPGDGFHADPYLYVGPHDSDRPGDPDYWNAPFGAVIGYEQLRAAPDPVAAGLAFLQEGMTHLAG